MGFFNKLFGLNKHKIDYNLILAKIDKGACIIDVRTEREFNEGSINNSENIPLQDINDQIELIKAKNKVIIAYCRSGNRSGLATDLLIKNGIEAHNGGGYMTLNIKLTT